MRLVSCFAIAAAFVYAATGGHVTQRGGQVGACVAVVLWLIWVAVVMGWRHLRRAA